MERAGPTPQVESSLDCDRCDRTDVFGFRRPLSDADRPALASDADRMESVCHHCRDEESSRPIGHLIDDRETDGERPGDDGDTGRGDAGQS